MTDIPWRHPRTLFVSFPKSGRTWFRFFLAKYLELAYGRAFSMNFEPELTFSHDFFGWIANQESDVEPRAVCADIDPREKAETALVWLVRDPRDVAVSYYYQKVHREGRVEDEGVDAFVLDPAHGIRRQCVWLKKMKQAHLDWCLAPAFEVGYESNHVESWEVSFERILMSHAASHDQLCSAIAASTFDAMQAHERAIEERDPDQQMGPGVTEHGWKVRRGKVGGWRDELRPETIEAMHEIPEVREALALLGYDR